MNSTISSSLITIFERSFLPIWYPYQASAAVTVTGMSFAPATRSSLVVTPAGIPSHSFDHSVRGRSGTWTNGRSEGGGGGLVRGADGRGVRVDDEGRGGLAAVRPVPCRRPARGGRPERHPWRRPGP